MRHDGATVLAWATEGDSEKKDRTGQDGTGQEKEKKREGRGGERRGEEGGGKGKGNRKRKGKEKAHFTDVTAPLHKQTPSSWLGNSGLPTQRKCQGDGVMKDSLKENR